MTTFVVDLIPIFSDQTISRITQPCGRGGSTDVFQGAPMAEKCLQLADDDYVPEPEWAKEHHVSRRTSSRHRHRNPGLPYLEWGGQIWIGKRQGAQYISTFARGRNRRLEPRRRRGLGPRKQTAEATP